MVWHTRTISALFLLAASAAGVVAQPPAAVPSTALAATPPVDPPATPPAPAYPPIRFPADVVFPTPVTITPAALPTPLPGVAPPVKYPTVEVGGVLQMDTGWFAQSADNRLQVGDAEDGAGFRTARLWARGLLQPTTAYMLEVDFGELASASPGRPNFQNVYLEQQELPLLGTVRVGRWKQPFSLETATSIRFLDFIERASLFAFVPFRRTGVGFFNATADERWTYAASVFRSEDDRYGGSAADTGGWATAERVTRLAHYEQDGARLLHLGLAHTWNAAPDRQVRFARFGEFAVSATPPGADGEVTPAQFDTGVMAAHDYHVFGGELAWVWGRLSVQAEGVLTAVNRIAAPRAVFPAGYVSATWFLTGEHRRYVKRAGAFDRVIPHRNFLATRGGGIEGPGAWQVAVRLSGVDATDAGVDGGRLGAFTVGLNWHLNPNAKLQFNYIRNLRSAPGVPDSTLDVFALRAAYDF